MDGRVLDRIASLRPGKKKVDWNVAGTRAKGKWCGGKGRERRGKGRTSRFVVIRSEQEKKGWVDEEGSGTRVYKQHQRDPRQHKRSLNGQWGLFTSLDEKRKRTAEVICNPARLLHPTIHIRDIVHCISALPISTSSIPTIWCRRPIPDHQWRRMRRLHIPLHIRIHRALLLLLLVACLRRLSVEVPA
jgi:hypothetical protein